MLNMSYKICNLPITYIVVTLNLPLLFSSAPPPNNQYDSHLWWKNKGKGCTIYKPRALRMYQFILNVLQLINKLLLCLLQVLNLFLDTLVDLLTVHSRDLINQLYMYLTKLLVKTGTDMLGSVQLKVQKALDAVRYVNALWEKWLLMSTLAFCLVFVSPWRSQSET